MAGNRRRRKKQNSGAFVIVVMLLLIFLVLYELVFVIRNVEVTGTSDISGSEIVRAADLDYGASIFSCSESRVRKGIDALGEIELVSLTKKMPSTVVIEVRKRVPEVVTLFQKTPVLLDGEGYVIKEVSSIPTDCIYVNGLHIMSCKIGSKITLANDQLAAMCAIVSALNEVNGDRYVSEVELSDTSNIQIKASNETLVTVGSYDNIRSKLAWMTAAIADLTQRQQSGGTLDVSSGTKADYVAPVVEESEVK